MYIQDISQILSVQMNFQKMCITVITMQIKKIDTGISEASLSVAEHTAYDLAVLHMY